MSRKGEDPPKRRPLVTMGLVAYRQERYVRAAVRSVLAQTYSPLQIVICDDASPDATFDIISQEVRDYRGDHKILLQRNSTNLGIGNFNRMMELAAGEFIVIAHGDDVSYPQRVERLVSTWLSSEVSLVSSNGTLISEWGEDLHRLFADPDLPKRVSAAELAEHGWSFWLFGGALAWERRVFDVWGPLDLEKSAVSTDWIIPFRAALLGGIAIVDEPLLKIRLHPHSKTIQYLHHPDPLVQRESANANMLTQFLYMLETVNEAQSRGLVSVQTSTVLRGLLNRSVFLSAIQWRSFRNRLLVQRRRAQWLPLDN
jgi:hypothetical protein